MLYRLTVSYRGEAYAGWQRQRNATGVQQVLEEAIEKLVSQSVSVLGASRTDAGVHALGQVVHVELATPWAASALVGGTSHHLPGDVRVMDAAEAPPGFHARRDAVAKEYHYRLSRAAVISPLDSSFVVAAPSGLDLALLRRAASDVEGSRDFTAFAKAGGSHTHPVRTVHRAEFLADGEELRFRIIGSGFLRGMVRALVGTLLEVGAAKRSLEDFRSLFDGRPRGEAGPNAKAHGLVLVRVFYESLRQW